MGDFDEQLVNMIDELTVLVSKDVNNNKINEIEHLYTVCERMFKPDDYIWDLINLLKDSASQDIVPDLTELETEIISYIRDNTKNNRDQALDNSFVPTIKPSELDQMENTYKEEQDAIYRLMNERRSKST